MLDVQLIRDHLEEVKANCRNRNVKADVDRVVRLDNERKRLVQETQLLQQRRNEVSALIPTVKNDPARKQTMVQEGRQLREKIEDDPARPKHISTVWGIGYRFDP